MKQFLIFSLAFWLLSIHAQPIMQTWQDSLPVKYPVPDSGYIIGTPVTVSVFGGKENTDEWQYDYLFNQVHVLSTHPERRGIYGGTLVLDKDRLSRTIYFANSSWGGARTTQHQDTVISVVLGSVGTPNIWNTLSEIPLQSRRKGSAVNKLYNDTVLWVTGGTCGTCVDQTSLNPAYTYFTFPFTNSMQTARAGHRVVTTQTAGPTFAIGGRDPSTNVPILDVDLALSNFWLDGPSFGIDPMPEFRESFAILSHGGYVYIAGGYDIMGNPTKSLFVLNVQTGEWIVGPELPYPIAEAEFSFHPLHGPDTFAIFGGTNVDSMKKFQTLYLCETVNVFALPDELFDIVDEEDEGKFSLSINVTTGLLDGVANIDPDKGSDLRVVNMSGIEIIKKNIRGRFTIDLTNFTSGVYIYEVISHNRNHPIIGRIIKY